MWAQTLFCERRRVNLVDNPSLCHSHTAILRIGSEQRAVRLVNDFVGN
jgi:hypothetical protein